MAQTDVTAAQAIANFRANRRVAAQTVSDTADQIARNLDGLRDVADNGGLASVTLSVAAPLAVSWAQYRDDGAVLDRVRGAFSLSVALAPASAAAALQADPRVAGFTVSDSASNIVERLDALNSAAKITAIIVANARPLVVSAAQAARDAAALAKVASGFSVAATVSSGSGRFNPVPLDDDRLSAPVQALLKSIDDDVTSGTLTLAPSLAGAGRGVIEARGGGQFAMGDDYSVLVGTATVPVTVFGGSHDGGRVLTGSGGIAFNAGSGRGTVLAGGGNNLISMLAGAGAQQVSTGGGDDTIVALTGANTISAGTGANQVLAQGGDDIINSSGDDLINVVSGRTTVNAAANNPTVFLGRDGSEFNGGSGRATVVVGIGASTLRSHGGGQLWLQSGGGLVTSDGADTIIGGSGSATVQATSGDDFVFAGLGRLEFRGGSGASTILGAASGSVSIAGGAGTVIGIAYGNTTYTGGSGADTIAAFGGSATITGGAGTGVFLGGPGGHNRIDGGSGRVTIFGGGDGDVLRAGSGAGDVIQAGSGAETISALGTTGRETFYTGSGRDLVLLGAGASQVLAGSGAATIVSGTGTDLFALQSGNHSDVVIRAFTSGKDFVSLLNYGTAEAARALAASTVVSGSQRLTLSDGATISFENVTGLTLRNFL